MAKKKQFNKKLLQKTHSTLKDGSLWRNEWGGKAFFTYSTTNKTDAVVLYAIENIYNR